MAVIHFIWVIVQLVIGYNLVLPLVLYFFYLIHLLFTKRRQAQASTIQEADYAIIVTAYEQTDLLHSVIESLLQLNYNNYIIYIVADKCDISGLNFADERVVVLRPEEVLASNVRSHFYAIDHFKRPHPRLTIIDSDNLVDKEYLNQLNIYFDKGYSAVQGLRAAKKLNSTFACLDAARDIYYHFYDGKVLYEIGSSATLAGSGMAFSTELYKSCFANTNLSGAGFDKVLQAAILKKGYRIAFNEDAIVYDEKTAHSEQLVKQRARWINTWFRYFSFGFGIMGKGITRFNWNQFLFGLVLLRPPLFIFLLLSVLFMVINIFIAPVAALIWLIGLLLFVVGFAIALLHSHTDKRIYQSLINIPRFMFFQVLSLMKVRNANKHSVATRHVVDEEGKH
jgi:cellulose synthase/poly-beta-1,6-N-acetylglucosamine synthase-like glycosyltransferase